MRRGRDTGFLPRRNQDDRLTRRFSRRAMFGERGDPDLRREGTGDGCEYVDLKARGPDRVTPRLGWCAAGFGGRQRACEWPLGA